MDDTTKSMMRHSKKALCAKVKQFMGERDQLANRIFALTSEVEQHADDVRETLEKKDAFSDSQEKQIVDLFFQRDKMQAVIDHLTKLIQSQMTSIHL